MGYSFPTSTGDLIPDFWLEPSTVWKGFFCGLVHKSFQNPMEHLGTCKAEKLQLRRGQRGNWARICFLFVGEVDGKPHGKNGISYLDTFLPTKIIQIVGKYIYIYTANMLPMGFGLFFVVSPFTKVIEDIEEFRPPKKTLCDRAANLWF